MAADEPLLRVELIERLADLAITMRRPILGAAQGAHRSRAHGAAVEFADYRSYTPGDPPHLIDWKVYARTDRYLIRQHEEETRLDARILLDVSESLAYREQGSETKARYAAHLAAALGYVLVRQQDRVGYSLFTDRIVHSEDFTGTMAGLQAQLEAIAGHAVDGPSNIAAALQEQAETGWRRGLIVIVSDFLEDVDQLRAATSHLQQLGHELWLVHVLDRAEVLLPYEGVASVRALEHGGRMVVELDAIRDRYRDAVEAHVAALRRLAAELGGRYHLAFTDVSLEQNLRTVARG
ncbi:MAG: DUF58 domain-containing protein [Planctomycetota bacterium]|jgi:uncharacterized protein (DUF58 family)|nr:DUF58 domain-containing protein [Planctomycetota bacterium]